MGITHIILVFWSHEAGEQVLDRAILAGARSQLGHPRGQKLETMSIELAHDHK